MDTIIHLSETTSTSDYIKDLIAEHPDMEEGTLVYADYQTKGRGQSQNVWKSAVGDNLTFSLALFPDFLEPHKSFLLSQVASLAVKDFLTLYCGLSDVYVKWPNDIYVEDRKICGMLIETNLIGHSYDYAVLGIGINLNQSEFPFDLPNPVSAKMLTGRQYDISMAAVQMRQCIMSRYMTLVSGDFSTLREDYFDSLYRSNGFFPFKDKNGEFEARIDNVLDDGQLVLSLKDDSKRQYWHKEVSFLLSNGDKNLSLY